MFVDTQNFVTWTKREMAIIERASSGELIEVPVVHGTPMLSPDVTFEPETKRVGRSVQSASHLGAEVGVAEGVAVVQAHPLGDSERTSAGSSPVEQVTLVAEQGTCLSVEVSSGGRACERCVRHDVSSSMDVCGAVLRRREKRKARKRRKRVGRRAVPRAVTIRPYPRRGSRSVAPSYGREDSVDATTPERTLLVFRLRL